MFQCRICSGRQPSASYVVKEMQFGTRAEFTYQLCGDCGCLQIEQLPQNLAAYYPSDYYSKKTRTVKTTDRLLDYFRQKRLQNHLGEPNALGAGLMRMSGRLPKDCKYLPVDLVPFTDQTIVLDLNRAHLRPIMNLPSNLVQYGHPGAVETVKSSGAASP